MSDKKKPGPKPKTPEPGLVTIECICSNVHIGGGVKLTATRNQHGNWVDGDVAQVSHADAVLMERNGQVKIL